MEDSLEQQYAIKFCVRLGKNATETFQMLEKAFKDDCIPKLQSEMWHKTFKEDREKVVDKPRSGRPTKARTDENVTRVRQVLRSYRLLSIQQIADTLKLSTLAVHGIVTKNLQMRNVYAKLVPKVLTDEQKKSRVSRCEELLGLIKNDSNFLNSVVTGDEFWMFKPVTTILIVFFDVRGIVHFEFVPQGQTVNAIFYLKVLKRLKDKVARVRADIKDAVKLHHDNAPSHTARKVTNFLVESSTLVVPQPPYSPDLAPCDFFLFPQLKEELKGKQCKSVENIQSRVTKFLKGIPVEEFQGAFQEWQTRLRECIDAGGDYF